MTLWRVVLVCGLASFLGACDDEDPANQGVLVPPMGGQQGMAPTPMPTTEGKTAAEWLPALGVPPDPIERALVSVPCGAAEGCVVPAKAEGMAGEFGCSFVLNRETKKAANDLVVLGPDEDLWPGNVLKANAARAGSLESVNVPRGPLVLTSTLQGGSSSVSLVDAKTSTVQAALNTLLAGQTVASGSAVASSIHIDSVLSREDLSKHFGVDLSLRGLLPVAAKLGLMSRKETITTHARVAVDFVQAFYRVTIDTPTNAGALFAADLPAATLSDALGGDRPVYVRSVTYGRRVVAVFEDAKSESTTALETAIKASYGPGSGGATFNIGNMNTSQVTRFAAVVLGDAAVFTSVDQLIAYLQKPADVSTAWPIAYSLANVADNSPFAVGNTTEIVTRTCMKCGLNDPYADAVDFSMAHAMSAMPISDSDGAAITLNPNGVLAPGAKRWFRFDGTDGVFGRVDPEVKLSTPMAGARVCLFAQCNAGVADPLCLAGVRTKIGSLDGCCSTTGQAQLEGAGDTLCLNGPDDARVYVLVDGTGLAGQCVQFGMTVHY